MELLLVSAFSQIFLPQIGLFWVWLGNVQSRLAWLLKLIIVAAYIIVIALAGPWVYLPWGSVAFYLFLLMAAAWHSYRTEAYACPWLPAWNRTGILRVTVFAGVAVALGWHILYLLSGWVLPGESPVSLNFPLRNGTYYILNGGSNRILNDHLVPASLKLAEFRGQSYGIDILKPEGIGERGAVRVPQDLSDYEIFGEPVHAPCSGTIVLLKDDLPDPIPPDTDLSHPAGNYLMLDCDGVRIVLQHLQQASILVGTGQFVTSGQRLADVGNSGDSKAPHLHIHAQKPGTTEHPFSGDPQPMTFAGRYLVRNSQISIGP